jgi:hypothetical protein
LAWSLGFGGFMSRGDGPAHASVHPENAAFMPFGKSLDNTKRYPNLLLTKYCLLKQEEAN